MVLDPSPVYSTPLCVSRVHSWPPPACVCVCVRVYCAAACYLILPAALAPNRLFLLSKPSSRCLDSQPVVIIRFRSLCPPSPLCFLAFSLFVFIWPLPAPFLRCPSTPLSAHSRPSCPLLRMCIWANRAVLVLANDVSCLRMVLCCAPRLSLARPQISTVNAVCHSQVSLDIQGGIFSSANTIFSMSNSWKAKFCLLLSVVKATITRLKGSVSTPPTMVLFGVVGSTVFRLF